MTIGGASVSLVDSLLRVESPRSGSCSTRLRAVGFSWKVDVRLPGKGDSDSHGARPVHQIISMLKRTQTSKFSIQNFLSVGFLQFEGWVLIYITKTPRGKVSDS